MRTRILCTTALLLTKAALAQADGWQHLMNEASTLELGGNYAAAATTYRGAARIAEQFGTRDERRVRTLNALATAYDELGRFPDAECEYRRALRAAEQVSGRTSSDYAVVLGNLASFYADLGQTRRGEALMRESVAIQEATARPDDVKLAIARLRLAQILLRPGKFGDAELLLNQSLLVLQKDPVAPTQTAFALNDLGFVRQHQRRNADAERLFQQSIGTLQSELGQEHPLLLRPLNNLATLYGQSGRQAEADTMFRHALTITERHLGFDHPIYGVLLHNYSVFLRGTREKTKAKALEVLSQRVLKDSARRNSTGMTIDVSAFGWTQ